MSQNRDIHPSDEDLPPGTPEMEHPFSCKLKHRKINCGSPSTSLQGRLSTPLRVAQDDSVRGWPRRPSTLFVNFGGYARMAWVMESHRAGAARQT